MDMTDLSARFFGALAANDLETAQALCAPDFTGSQNGGPAMDAGTLMQFTGAVHTVVSGFRYEDAIRTATTSGFVEEHRVRGTLPDGSELDLMACVVAEVTDGRIAALREYVDTGAAAGLLKALGR